MFVTQIIGRRINTYCRAALGGGGDACRIGFGSRVDGESKLLIDSALFLELREGGVFTFPWQGVCLVPCHSVQRPRDPSAHLQLTFSISASYY